MKIGFVYPWFAPSVGGVETYMKNLHEEFEKLGHEVHVFTSDEHHRGPDRNEKRSHVHFIETKLLLGYRIPQKKSVRENLEQYPVDILHCNGPHPYTTAFAWYAGGKKRGAGGKRVEQPKRILTYHAHANPASFLPRIAAAIEKYFYRFLFDGLVVTTHWYEKEVRKFYPRKRIRVIPLGVQKTLFKKPAERKPERPFREVLFVGALDDNHRYKGMEILLESARQVPYVQYTVIGDGNKRNFLERTAEERGLENVKFLGSVSTEKLRAHYVQADVLILPSTSNSEGYGIVLLEAMACGTPVITTDKVGSHEEIVKAQAGMIVRASDPDHLSKAIKELLSSPELREKIVQNGYALVQDRSWDKVAAETLNFYGKLTAKN